MSAPVLSSDVYVLSVSGTTRVAPQLPIWWFWLPAWLLGVYVNWPHGFVHNGPCADRTVCRKSEQREIENDDDGDDDNDDAQQ